MTQPGVNCVRRLLNVTRCNKITLPLASSRLTVPQPASFTHASLPSLPSLPSLTTNSSFDSHYSPPVVPSKSPESECSARLYSVPPKLTQKILQWNLNSLNSQMTRLKTDLYRRRIQIAMLQELLPHYKLNRSCSDIRYYHVYCGVYGKTGIYVHQDVLHHHIPLRCPTNLEPIQMIHGTAILAHLYVQNKLTPTVILNLYRSPSGHANPMLYLNYIQQIRAWLTKKRMSPDHVQWLIGGDLNAKHPSWGSPHKNSNAHKIGRQIHDHLQAAPYDLLNNGQPTRWWTSTTGTTTRFCYSHIDLSWSSHSLAKHLVWRVLPLERGSDHFQILMDIDEPLQITSSDQSCCTWKIPNSPKKWSKFETSILDNNDATLTQMNNCLNSADSPQEICSELTDLTIALYTTAAFKAFKYEPSDRRWPRTVSKKGEALSIKYNKLFTRYRRLKTLTRHQHKHLLHLRRERNREHRDYLRRYFNRAYSYNSLHTRDGWQVASHLRGLYDREGKSVPSLIDPTTGVIVASQPLEKAQHLNDYYHRHQNAQPLPSSYCWKPPNIIRPAPRPLPSTPVVKQHCDPEPDNPLTTPGLQSQHWRVYDTDTRNHEFEQLDDHFGHRIMTHVRAKWDRIQDPHKQYPNRTKYEYYSHMLNCPFTKAEVRRSLASFTNHKAYGPDLVHIQFLKRLPCVSHEILLCLYNGLLKLGHVPTILKKRWITPIVKPGKTGRIPKDLRPISLTSYIGKILEKMLQYRLVTYLSQLELIDTAQFAYLPGRSTSDSLVYLLDRIQRNLNNSRQATSNVVFFDFSSAFDTVRHNLLLWKLQFEYFITGVFLVLITQLLIDRLSAVKIDNCLSTWIPDTLGVPQGGALSPLLYILYMDGLGVLNCIQGLYLSLFADDLCLFTDSMRQYEQHKCLQEGIFFIQWYSLQLGLKLNLTKTVHAQFHNCPRTPPRHPTLQFSQHINNHFALLYDFDVLDNDLSLTFTDEPVKYLGIMLDPTLNFKAHGEYIEKKCNRIFYTMQRQLKQLWHISADIAWMLFDVCILTIFDYSSILWPCLQQKTKYSWMRIYNRILRTAFHAPRSTPRIHILHHLNVPALPQRMELLNSKIFSRIIRSPMGTALHHLFDNTWWPYLRHQMLYHPSEMIPRKQLSQLSWPKDKKWKKSHLRPLHGTIIWLLIRNAMYHENDDLSYITPSTTLAMVQPRLSSYIDLTLPWTYVDYCTLPYDDWLVLDNTTPRDLLVFPDGSVENGNGGFGYLVLPASLYTEWSYASVNGYPRLPHATTTHVEDFYHFLNHRASPCDVLLYHQPLSSRCTIEFCEALAINHSMLTIAQKARADATFLLHVPSIRFISDSLVVLRYIIGTYTIRSPSMRNIIHDIHWNMSILKEQYPTLIIVFQWTKSHSLTFGNDVADDQANQGRLQLNDISTELTEHSDWQYITLRAVCNRAKPPFWRRLQEQLTRATRQSRFGRLYQTKNSTKLTWTKKYRKSMRFLSRNEYRMLLAMRTGHGQLNYYRHQLLSIAPSPLCPCQHGAQTMKHHMTRCTLPDIVRYRAFMRRSCRTAIQNYVDSLSERKYHLYLRQKQQIDFNHLYTYTDPPTYLPPSVMRVLQRSAVQLYRLAVKHSHMLHPR